MSEPLKDTQRYSALTLSARAIRPDDAEVNGQAAHSRESSIQYQADKTEAEVKSSPDHSMLITVHQEAAETIADAFSNPTFSKIEEVAKFLSQEAPRSRNKKGLKLFVKAFEKAPQTRERGLSGTIIEDALTRNIQDWAQSLGTTRGSPFFDADKGHTLSGGTDRQLISRRSPKLPMFLSGVSVTATPDTGSDENAISLELAQTLGLHVRDCFESAASFHLANGREIRSCGAAVSTWAFAKAFKGEDQGQMLLNVFESLAVPLIMGRIFLNATETLTKHKSRLESVALDSCYSIPRILHLNRPQQRLRCYLNVNIAYANADTGAQMNLASPAFVSQRGFCTEAPDPDHREVVLADGSTASISGQFKARFDTFEKPSKDSLRPRAAEKWFYILEGLTTDVLLRDDLLLEICAFSEQQNAFIDLAHLRIYSDLNLVTWLSKAQKRLIRLSNRRNSSGTTSASTGTGISPGDASAALEVAFQLGLDDDDAREQLTRREADVAISRLSEPERSGKEAEERARRQLYNESRARRIQEHNTRMTAIPDQQNSSLSSTS